LIAFIADKVMPSSFGRVYRQSMVARLPANSPLPATVSSNIDDIMLFAGENCAIAIGNRFIILDNKFSF